MTCTTLVVGVVTVAATTIVFTHWAPPVCNGGCWPPQHRRMGHQWRKVAVELCISLTRRRKISCLWWEGMVLPYPLTNIGHSTKDRGVVCIPMKNTFSAYPQVSDTVLSQYIVVRDDVITSRWVEFTQGHRTSSSPMFPIHTNNSRREEGCYVWWLWWIKHVQSSVHCWAGKTFCGECDHTACVQNYQKLHLIKFKNQNLSDHLSEFV